MTRWGVHYGKRYKQWRTDAATLLEESSTPPLAQPLRVNVVFAIPRSKSGKLATPVGDGDNYEKAIYDLIQSKGYLEDDRWITRAVWRKRFLKHGQQGYTQLTIFKDNEEIEI